MHDLVVEPAEVRVWHLEASLQRPRRNAFSEMRSRPALVVRLTLKDGSVGWGEVFCNWPAFAARHRAAILTELLAPLIVNRVFDNPDRMTAELSDKTHRIALQSGEPGPFAQAIAGLDIAAWDAAARRANAPLHAILSARAEPGRLPVYASALTSETIDELVPPLKDAGWNGFKIKVGFGMAKDEESILRLRSLIGTDAALMTDANQNWDFRMAKECVSQFVQHGVLWVEEPIAADSPANEWRHLNSRDGPLLAAGENIRGVEAFERAITSGVNVIQPDIIKWGGISGMLRVSELASLHDVMLAPHYLGGGIGLAATAHVARACAAAWLEYDVTENPLRDQLLAGAIAIKDGEVIFCAGPGHGASPSTETLDTFTV